MVGTVNTAGRTGNKTVWFLNDIIVKKIYTDRSRGKCLKKKEKKSNQFKISKSTFAKLTNKKTVNTERGRPETRQ